MMGNAVIVTDENFEDEVLGSSLPVMVDFWARWCGPCSAMAPVIDNLASEFGGRLKVAKADVEQSQKAAMQHRIRAIPTILFFKDGKVVDEVVGTVPVDELRTRVQGTLEPS
ncbi:MAG: thioredoxin [bacterium]